MTTTATRANRMEFPDSIDAAMDWMEAAFENGWTNGLPVVPPTEKKVHAMLDAVDRDPQEVLGEIPPRMGRPTVEAVAIQAVMGGWKSAYFPVVLAAIEAMLEEPFNLNGVQATTHNVAPLCIVSGPIVQELGINCGTNLFGGGFRANGTIGRAIRLVMWNLGGRHPRRRRQEPHGPARQVELLHRRASGRESLGVPPRRARFPLGAQLRHHVRLRIEP